MMDENLIELTHRSLKQTDFHLPLDGLQGGCQENISGQDFP